MPPKVPRPFPLDPLTAVLRRWEYIRDDVPLHRPRERTRRKVGVRGDRSNPLNMPEVFGDDATPPTNELRILLTQVCGLTASEWWAARTRGGLTELQADRCAAALGMHPSAVWGDLWRHVTAEAIAAEERALFEQLRHDIPA